MGTTYQQIVPLLALAALLVIISYLGATPRGVATELTRTFVISAAFFVIVCRLIDEKLLNQGVLAIAVVLVGASAVAVLQYVIIAFHLDFPSLLTFLPAEQRIGYFEDNLIVGQEGVRLSSFFFHSNQLGHFLEVTFIFYFPIFLASDKISHRLGYGLLVGLSLASLLLTQSRGALMLIIIGVAIVFVVNGKHLFSRRRYSVVLVLVGALIGSGLMFGSNLSSFSSRIASFDLSHREHNWIYALEIIPEHLPLGVGMGGSGYHILSRFPPVNSEDLLTSYYARQALNYWSGNPHNYYLATVLETGIFSLVAQLLLFGSLILVALRVHRRTLNSHHKSLAIGGALVLGLEFLRGLYESYGFFGAPETSATLAFVCAVLLYLEEHLPKTTTGKLGSGS
jgi:O-antigen ligase